MSLLNFDSITKEYGDLVAVDDCSFDISDGEFISILGPSGSGKSTMLRMIAGFEDPTEGTIEIEGEDLESVPPFERDTNMVFQDLALFPHLTVAENIEYGLKNKDVPEEERERKVEEMLEMVQLGGYGDRQPEELSGGEQQRVALVRALVNEPVMVLFDEPLASLDRQLRQHMQVELQQIQDQTDTTFLYVTHDQEVAMAVSDRLILLKDGEIEQIGTAEELYETPASQFVANFIGDVNTIDATVSEVDDGEFVFDTASGDMEIAVETRQLNDPPSVGRGDSVQLCVRPPDVELVDGDSDADVSVQGRVRNRIYKGDAVRYILDTDVGEVTVDAEVGEPQIDDTVRAAWKMRDGFVFSSGETADGDASRTTVAQSGQ